MKRNLLKSVLDLNRLHGNTSESLHKKPGSKISMNHHKSSETKLQCVNVNFFCGGAKNACETTENIFSTIFNHDVLFLMFTL